jgi:hypothetical protein
MPNTPAFSIAVNTWPSTPARIPNDGATAWRSPAMAVSAPASEVRIAPASLPMILPTASNAGDRALRAAAISVRAGASAEASDPAIFPMTGSSPPTAPITAPRTFMLAETAGAIADSIPPNELPSLPMIEANAPITGTVALMIADRPGRMPVTRPVSARMNGSNAGAAAFITPRNPWIIPDRSLNAGPICGAMVLKIPVSSGTTALASAETCFSTPSIAGTIGLNDSSRLVTSDPAIFCPLAFFPPNTPCRAPDSWALFLASSAITPPISATPSPIPATPPSAGKVASSAEIPVVIPVRLPGSTNDANRDANDAPACPPASAAVCSVFFSSLRSTASFADAAAVSIRTFSSGCFAASSSAFAEIWASLASVSPSSAVIFSCTLRTSVAAMFHCSLGGPWRAAAARMVAASVLQSMTRFPGRARTSLTWPSWTALRASAAMTASASARRRASCSQPHSHGGCGLRCLSAITGALRGIGIRSGRGAARSPGSGPGRSLWSGRRR